MKRWRLLVTMALSATATGVLAAPVNALTCYVIEFDHPPRVTIVSIQPLVIIYDDGDPYVRSYPC